MEINIRPSFRAKYSKLPQKEVESRTERFANDQRDEKIIRQMWILVSMGLTIFLGGFAIWNLDNMYCSTIRRWRYDIGLPWGLLLEGHGWCTESPPPYWAFADHCRAHHDRNRLLFLPRLGHIPPTLSQRTSRRVHAQLATLVLYSRSHSDSDGSQKYSWIPIWIEWDR